MQAFSDENDGINELVDAVEKLHKEFEQRIIELKLIHKRHYELRKMFEKVSRCQYVNCSHITTTEKELSEFIKEWEKVNKKILELTRNLNIHIKKRQLELIEPIKEKVQYSLEKYAKRNEYETVFDLSHSSVNKINTGNAFDITKEFIKFYNSRNNTEIK